MMRNCVTLHVTKLQLQECFLLFETTMADRFLGCVRLKRLFATLKKQT